MKKHVVIVGAGPSGLTAAYSLLKRSQDYDVTIIEKESYVGGISRTFNYKGNRMDIGGHRFFSKNERVNELWDLSWFMFQAPETYDTKSVTKFWKGENPARIAALREVLAGIDDFSKEHTEKVVFDWIAAHEYPMGQVMNTFRIAIVGAGSGPSIMDICAIIGKEETLKRIDNALLRLNHDDTTE